MHARLRHEGDERKLAGVPGRIHVRVVVHAAVVGAVPGTVYGWPKNTLHWQGIDNSIVELATTIPVHYVIADGIEARVRVAARVGGRLAGRFCGRPAAPPSGILRAFSQGGLCRNHDALSVGPLAQGPVQEPSYCNGPRLMEPT